MSLWRQLTRGLRVLTNRAAADRDVADEVQHFLDSPRRLTSRAGCRPRRPGAPRGSSSAVRPPSASRCAVTAGRTLSARCSRDLRYAARRLRAAPGFTAITVLTLALGIGGTTAIFSAVNPILFESLPYPHADRIAMILGAARRRLAQRRHVRHCIASSPNGRAPSRRSPCSEPGSRRSPARIEPERLDGQRVSASYFRVLGVSPILGRDFEPSDDRLNGPNVVILSDALWRRRFDGDRAIVGRADSRSTTTAITVIGVMPGGFENVLAPVGRAVGAAAVRPSLPRTGALGPPPAHGRPARGRASGASRRAREIHATRAGARRAAASESYGPDTLFAVVPLQDELTRGVKPALLAILGAVSPGARDRVRERDQPAARPRCAAPRRVRAARRARRRARPTDPAAAHREPPPRRDGRRRRHGGGDARRARARRAQPAGPAARRRDRRRRRRVRLRRWRITTLIGLAFGLIPGAAGGAQRSRTTTSSTARHALAADTAAPAARWSSRKSRSRSCCS